MRVLHISAGNIFGGVETHLLTLARFRHLCPEMDVHFGVCVAGLLSERLAAAGVPVHMLGHARASRPWTIWQSRRRLREVVLREGIEAVICHMSWAHAVFGPAARSAGCRSVIFLQNRVSGDHWLDRWARRTVPDLILAVSKDTAETSKNLYPGLPAQVVYSPMPEFETHSRAEVRSDVRKELETAANATVIIQVSRMEEWKGHPFHLEALARLASRPDWTCWIVGGPQNASEIHYLDSLRSLANRLGIGERVKFLGQRKDVPRLMAAADVFCQPNIGTEGFSWVFMEAFAASLPIVTSSIGGAVEIVDKSSGMLVPPRDVPKLAGALEKFMDDPDLCRTMGAAGRKRVQQLCDRASQIRKLHEALLALTRQKVVPSAQSV